MAPVGSVRRLLRGGDPATGGPWATHTAWARWAAVGRAAGRFHMGDPARRPVWEHTLEIGLPALKGGVRTP